jgi:hypothetical protein
VERYESERAEEESESAGRGVERSEGFWSGGSTKFRREIWSICFMNAARGIEDLCRLIFGMILWFCSLYSFIDWIDF